MTTKQLEQIALSIRTLSMDAVQKANSGHPGLPLGLAELGALLYGKVLNHNPKNPKFINRDRLVLSAGHGSMWLYSLLHLSGYNVTLNDIKQFRQLGSKTAGHPEYHHTEGVETTTGPLGAGFATAVGMAMAQQMMASRFNTSNHSIISNYTYTIMGDGCMMEGVTSEAASLAGTLKLNKLIAFYDSNHITIEGDTDIAFTEDVAKRYVSYGWQVLECSAYDFTAMENHINHAKNSTKPTLIILNSIIAKGAPTMAGSHNAHGAPLGNDEIKAFRIANNIPSDIDFYIAPEAKEAMENRLSELAEMDSDWQSNFETWGKDNPQLKTEFNKLFTDEEKLLANYKPPIYNVGDKIATRVAGGKALNALANISSKIVGGSADLSPSNNTTLINMGDISASDFSGRNVHFGVREHAMGNIVNGLTLYGPFRAFGATFLVFSDYMRPTVRLAALMNLPSIFIFTHDSIFVGEDGPTHEPIEHIESLRMIPNLTVLRPADAEETNLAYEYAFKEKNKPTVIALTRHNLEVFIKPNNWQEQVIKGAYIALDSKDPEVVVFATGSEVTTAIKAANSSNKSIRVVSVFDRNKLFGNHSYIEELAPNGVKKIAIEAGVPGSWYKLTPHVLCIESFGLSGKADDVAKALNFTSDDLAKLF